MVQTFTNSAGNFVAESRNVNSSNTTESLGAQFPFFLATAAQPEMLVLFGEPVPYWPTLHLSGLASRFQKLGSRVTTLLPFLFGGLLIKAEY